MANLIMIIGESGTGKSTSIETLNENETFIIQVVNKPLPFKNFKNRYKLKTSKDSKGNRIITDSVENILRVFKVLEDDKKIKNVVIDDSQYIMANEFMRRAKEKGYEKFTEIAQNFYSLIEKAATMRQDLNIIFLHHSEVTEDGRTKSKTVGKLIDKAVCIEGRFSVVLATHIEDGQYFFRTQNNGYDTCKSPKGMFDELLIPNDLNLVITKCNEYFN